MNDLLDFAKLEAGKIALDEQQFSIEELIKDAVASVAPEAGKKALVVNYALSRELPTKLFGDPIRLRQVLLNLLHNAVKFTQDGRVDISARLAARSEENVLVSFEVSDTGIGITEEVQRKLFEPFVQADGSTTRRYGGTGLGLSICKSLVELMSGRTGVRSKVGEGSTFWFTIPLYTSLSRMKPLFSDEAA